MLLIGSEVNESLKVVMAMTQVTFVSLFSAIHPDIARTSRDWISAPLLTFWSEKVGR
jgi:hypothetical protein